MNAGGDDKGNVVWDIKEIEGVPPLTACMWHMEGTGPVVIPYIHSYGAELRGGSENSDDIGGRGRMSSGVACNVRTPVAVEKVARDRPAMLR